MSTQLLPYRAGVPVVCARVFRGRRFEIGARNYRMGAMASGTDVIVFAVSKAALIPATAVVEVA